MAEGRKWNKLYLNDKWLFIFLKNWLNISTHRFKIHYISQARQIQNKPNLRTLYLSYCKTKTEVTLKVTVTVRGLSLNGSLPFSWSATMASCNWLACQHFYVQNNMWSPCSCVILFSFIILCNFVFLNHRKLICKSMLKLRKK